MSRKLTKAAKIVLLDKFLEDKDKEVLFNKTVDCVKEVRHKLTPTLVVWVGETVDGFFRAILIGGTIMLHWAEREYELTYGLSEGKYVGGIESVLNALRNLKDENDFTDYLNSFETLKNMAEDTKLVTFKDVMKLLKWKFKNRKITVDTSDFSIS